MWRLFNKKQISKALSYVIYVLDLAYDTLIYHLVYKSDIQIQR